MDFKVLSPQTTLSDYGSVLLEVTGMNSAKGSGLGWSQPQKAQNTAKCFLQQDFQDCTITWSVNDVEEERFSFGVWQNNRHWGALDPHPSLKHRNPGLQVKKK